MVVELYIYLFLPTPKLPRCCLLWARQKCRCSRLRIGEQHRYVVRLLLFDSCRSDVTIEARWRQWWGDNNLISVLATAKDQWEPANSPSASFFYPSPSVSFPRLLQPLMLMSLHLHLPIFLLLSESSPARFYKSGSCQTCVDSGPHLAFNSLQIYRIL